MALAKRVQANSRDDPFHPRHFMLPESRYVGDPSGPMAPLKQHKGPSKQIQQAEREHEVIEHFVHQYHFMESSLTIRLGQGPSSFKVACIYALYRCHPFCSHHFRLSSFALPQPQIFKLII